MQSAHLHFDSSTSGTREILEASRYGSDMAYLGSAVFKNTKMQEFIFYLSTYLHIF